MKYKTIGVLLVVSIFAAGVFMFAGGEQMSEPQQKVEHADMLEEFEISPSEVVRKKQSGSDVVLLDVRTLPEYEKIHLQDAVLLPVQEISQKTLAAIGLGEDAKDTEIILYCRSGSRSKQVYDIMTALGYTNITSVAGGMVHWQEDEYPMTESGPYTGISYGETPNDAIANVDGAKITLDRTLEQLGVIPQYGGVVESDFLVTNDGTQTLEIGDITTSCSCTTAIIEDSSIEPGEQTVLKVIFDPDFHAEPLDVFTRTVFIPTNDPSTPEAEVTIEVDIQEGQ